MADADAAIRLTDTDAALARLSAVQKRYLEDPFVKHLVPRAHLQPARAPLINIGTFVRTTAIDDLVFRWLQTSASEGTRCQITGAHKDALATYIELDFPEITTKKAMAIRKSKELSAVLNDVKVSHGGTGIASANYHLLPADIRLPPDAALANHLSDEILSPTLPTLLLFECVLVYMAPESSAAVLRWFVERQTGPLGSIVYEMFRLQDSFGRVMVENLKARNVSLPGAAPYPSMESLPTRFTSVGFSAAQALTLKDIRKSYIATSELERIAHLELVDEIEELELVLDHYAITWGIRAPPERVWGQWGLVKATTVVVDED